MKSKKFYLFLILLATAILKTVGQDTDSRWNHSAYINLIKNNNVSFSYTESSGKAYEKTLSEKGVLEINYHLDYKLFKKLSAGASGGITRFIQPGMSTLTLGANLKVLYVNDKFHYLMLQYGYHVPLSKDTSREGHQIRIGQYFDVTQIGGLRLLLGLFYSYDFFYLEEDGKLAKYGNIPFSIRYDSAGISLGVKF